MKDTCNHQFVQQTTTYCKVTNTTLKELICTLCEHSKVVCSPRIKTVLTFKPSEK